VKDAKLIVQLPRGSAVERQLSAQAPESVARGEVVVQVGPTDAEGRLEAPSAGQIVLSLPSPEALERQASEVRRVIGQSGTGVEPLIVAVEAPLQHVGGAVVVDAAHGHRVDLDRCQPGGRRGLQALLDVRETVAPGQVEELLLVDRVEADVHAVEAEAEEAPAAEAVADDPETTQETTETEDQEA